MYPLIHINNSLHTLNIQTDGFGLEGFEYYASISRMWKMLNAYSRVEFTCLYSLVASDIRMLFHKLGKLLQQSRSQSA